MESKNKDVNKIRSEIGATTGSAAGKKMSRVASIDVIDNLDYVLAGGENRSLVR